MGRAILREEETGDGIVFFLLYKKKFFSWKSSVVYIRKYYGAILDHRLAVEGGSFRIQQKCLHSVRTAGEGRWRILYNELSSGIPVQAGLSWETESRRTISEERKKNDPNKE